MSRLSSERDMQNSRFFIFFPIWLCSDDFENPIFQSYLRKLFRTGYDTFDTH